LTDRSRGRCPTCHGATNLHGSLSRRSPAGCLRAERSRSPRPCKNAGRNVVGQHGNVSLKRGWHHLAEAPQDSLAPRVGAYARAEPHEARRDRGRQGE
jgi:hypothetical protein